MFRQPPLWNVSKVSRTAEFVATVCQGERYEPHFNHRRKHSPESRTNARNTSSSCWTDPKSKERKHSLDKFGRKMNSGEGTSKYRQKKSIFRDGSSVSEADRRATRTSPHNGQASVILATKAAGWIDVMFVVSGPKRVVRVVSSRYMSAPSLCGIPVSVIGPKQLTALESADAVSCFIEIAEVRGFFCRCFYVSFSCCI